jgi:hypothetical protein
VPTLSAMYEIGAPWSSLMSAQDYQIRAPEKIGPA